MSAPPLLSFALALLSAAALSACGEDVRTAGTDGERALPQAPARGGDASNASGASGSAPEDRSEMVVEPAPVQTAPAMTVTPPPVGSGGAMTNEPPPTESQAGPGRRPPAQH